MATLVTMTGASGSQYSYGICTFFGNWAKEPGNYAFTHPNSQGSWRVIYIGEAKNLHERMANHEKWTKAVQLGATHVLAHVNPSGAVARLAEEADLIAAYNPPLNVQLRTASLAAEIFGPARSKRRASILGGK
jgi:excinuclease UvrABC nuclease subunit